MSYHELDGQKGLFNSATPRAWVLTGKVVRPSNEQEVDQIIQMVTMHKVGDAVRVSRQPFGLKYPTIDEAKAAFEELQDKTLE